MEPPNHTGSNIIKYIYVEYSETVLITLSAFINYACLQ